MPALALTFRSIHVAIDNPDASLMRGRNYIVARYTGENPAAHVEIKSYYVIMRETLARKCIYNKFTTTTTVDEIINVNASKAPCKA